MTFKTMLHFMDTTKVNVAVGQRMREIRSRAGRSQATVAAKLGVTQATISKWEQGRGVTIGQLAAYADALGVPVTDLLPNGPHRSGDATPSAEARRLARALLEALSAEEEGGS